MAKLTYYEKQKAEKRDLQRQLINLTRLQRQLLHARNKSTKTNAVPSQTMWEDIAGKILMDLQASEELHHFLLSAVRGKHTLIGDLVTLVRQHMRTLRAITTQCPDLYSDEFLQPSDELVYVMYIHELNGVYKQTDQVFKECGMVSSDESAASQRALTTEQGTPIVEIGWQKVLPFSYRRTCDSMWMLSNLVHQQEAREEFEDVGDPDNIVAAKVLFTKRLEGGGDQCLVHRFVKRRFIEEDRVVTVWKSSIRGDGSFRGLQVQGTGWSVFRRSESEFGTVNQTCTRHTSLHLCSGNKVPGTLAKQFEGFVHSMVRENYQEITRMAESLLLDDAVGDIKM